MVTHSAAATILAAAVDGFFRFESPWWLLLLLMIPAVFLWNLHAPQPPAIAFSSTRYLPGRLDCDPQRIPRVLLGLAITSFILALARPQWGSGTSETEASGIDIVLAVDLSSSMLGLDMEDRSSIQRRYERGEPLLTRLEAVKAVLSDFIEKRPSDRIGIVAFARHAYLVSPLTLNHSWLQQQVQRLDVGLIEDKTNLAAAIVLATNRLKELEDAQTRLLVLLTDGEHNVDEAISPELATEAAQAVNVRIHTVAAGTRGQILTLLPKRSGTGYQVDRSGRPIVDRALSQFDAERLARFAESTGGSFFEAGDGAALAKAYAAIDELEKTDVKLRFRTSYREMFTVPATIGLISLIIANLLANFHFRPLP